ncbi:MAG: hypothetical protein VCB42_03130 [Myxococcota bacterium]
MKPELDRFLEVAAVHLLTRSAPALAGYEQSSVMTLGMMLTAAREEAERAAARRIEENAALRELFSEASGVVELPALRERLTAAAQGGEESFLISDLESGNAALRQLLIELHVAIEDQGGDAARAIERKIWSELSLSTERRKLSLGPF